MKIRYSILALLYGAYAVSAQQIEFAIIAPTYNNMSPDPKTKRPFCVEHIESIAKQKYPHALYKIYCIDDCSTDGTADMLDRMVTSLGIQDITVVHRNKQRKKALYNIWHQIHALPDHVVVVTVDGDDPLPHKNVLSRLAYEYQDPNVWLTYGQFQHYPSGMMGHCAPFSEEVIKKRAYRKHPWLASHLRTFKAGLFKNIKLEDLISKDNEFYPMTWDQAFMFPMLEMASKGHFRFISEVLYLYKETPRNDYKVDYSLMARLEKEIRSKRTYKALNSFPKMAEASPVDLVVFSKDRPLQLYAHLESVQTYLKNVNSIQVIYHAANADYAKGYEEVKKDFPHVRYLSQSMHNPKSDFKRLTIEALNQCTSKYMMFAVDDIIVKDFCDLKECTNALNHTQAYAFYLRLGLHVTECYSENRSQGLPRTVYLYDDVYAWRFATGNGDWGYPHSVDMTIVRTSKIKKQIQKLDFNTPNTLEAVWAWKGNPPMQKFGLCFSASKMVNLPLNIVQSDYKNRNMEYSANDLHHHFKQGQKINIVPLQGIKNRSAHMEYSPTFINR